MNPAFCFVTHNGIELLACRAWWGEGIVHGMTTRALSFRDESFAESAHLLCQAVGAAALAVPRQSHGNLCVQLPDKLEAQLARERTSSLFRFAEGDAVVAPCELGSSVAFGVMTADCVPVVVRARSGWAVIHAGWRGLANGVIRGGIERLCEPLEAAVFASAGGGCYEVGPEVIEAIGSSAVFTAAPGGGGKLLLDTATTAISQLREVAPRIRAVSAEICTISDHRFHSHRRDGDRAGRAITFVLSPRGNP